MEGKALSHAKSQMRRISEVCIRLVSFVFSLSAPSVEVDGPKLVRQGSLSRILKQFFLLCKV